MKQASRFTYLKKERRPLSSVEVLARRMRELEKARLLAEEERSHFLPTGWGSSKHGPGGQGRTSPIGVGWSPAKSIRETAAKKKDELAQWLEGRRLAKDAKETTSKQSQPRLRFQMLAVEY